MLVNYIIVLYHKTKTEGIILGVADIFTRPLLLGKC